MGDQIPINTIQAFARSIFKEASSYGFAQVDVIRLVNELMDCCTTSDGLEQAVPPERIERPAFSSEASELPLTGKRLKIRAFDRAIDTELLERWLPDKYGRFFVLSCATAQVLTVQTLAEQAAGHLGIITSLDDQPIGALAYLDHNADQKRAELRKLIGEPSARGAGLAEEATRLWIQYGTNALGLEKIYVSTLQTHISNIKLNERVGFHVEGLLQNEVVIDGERHDVLRMGYCC